MGRSANDSSGADRTRWLAELARAIDEAQRVAWRLGVLEGDNPQARALYFRLETARLEVEALRRRRWGHEAGQVTPQWMRSLVGAHDLFGSGEPPDPIIKPAGGRRRQRKAPGTA